MRDTIEDLLPGVVLDAELLRALPDDANQVFDNDATQQAVSEKLITSVAQLAEDTARKITALPPAERATALSLSQLTASSDSDLRLWIARFGRRALRRALTPAEVQSYVDDFLPKAKQGDDFFVAAERILASMLQDVEFLYRIEQVANPASGEITPYATATRMS